MKNYFSYVHTDINVDILDDKNISYFYNKDKWGEILIIINILFQ